MEEFLLNAILNLFALISSQRGPNAKKEGRKQVKRYLSTHIRLDDISEYIGLFDEFFDFALELDSDTRKRTAWKISENLASKLPREDQILTLLNLMTLLSESGAEGEFISFGMVIAAAMDMDGDVAEALNLLTFHSNNYSRLNQAFLVLDNGALPDDACCKRLVRKDFKANWTMLHVAETNTCFLVITGEALLTINGQVVMQGQFQVVEPGAILRDAYDTPCYYAEITAALFGTQVHDRVVFTGERVDFRFPKSENGLHSFSFRESSGHMIGVMGGSGTGKSTLLSILSGTLKPRSGQIMINGHNLYTEQGNLEGVIGLVPQDDLLFEDLTVWQNLYFNARLCLANLNEEKLQKRVEQTLKELDQYEIRDLKVGSSLEKTISGGQRKRLNIALELIREPAILFADEPTSGLSSADSLNVMSLLKEQALKGRVVIVVIHQPSSAIFKLFDTLWILDKGGRPAFTGNPMDALVYFRSSANLAGMDECICPSCGNFNPEQIFEILETRAVDERGHFTSNRRFSAEYWHQRYLNRLAEPPQEVGEEKLPIPAKKLWKPGLCGQLKVFFTRNLLSRLSNRQYILINLLEAPAIALVLALLCRFSPGSEYVFMENKNISMFFFMSVIVAVFMGLSVSSEEIIKDRKILKREGFLKLSWFSYINAKSVFLVVLTAIQTLAFTLVAHAILEIPDMTLKVWAILFSCGFCAVLAGLNISSGLRSVVAIYILVPLLIIPQMLLGGSVISFNELIPQGARNNHVPFYANVMPTRWGYEALIVEQYSSNLYQRETLEDDCSIRQVDYLIDGHIQEMRSLADFLFLKTSVADKERIKKRNLRVLDHEVSKMEALTDISSGLDKEVFQPGAFNLQTLKKLKRFLSQVAAYLRTERTAAFRRKTEAEKKRRQILGLEGVEELKAKHFNKSIAQVVQNSMGLESLRVSVDRLIQLDSPISKQSGSSWGMAHFAAGWKEVGDRRISTFYFNLCFLWLISLALYLCLYFKVLPRLLRNVPTA